MASLKSVLVLGLLFALSLAVLADTTRDETRSKEVTDSVEPQQGGGCRRCCGAYAFGRCSACCKENEEPVGHVTGATEVVETQLKGVNTGKETDSVEPQQGGGCRRCCGAYAFGRCSACCKENEEPVAHVAGATDAVETQMEDKDGVEPQQRGGCKRCCGAYAFGRCSACCKENEEPEAVEPQQGGRCRYGCCGAYAFGRCSACCTRKMTPEADKEQPAP